VAEAQKA
jgi:hypothetical protein